MDKLNKRVLEIITDYNNLQYKELNIKTPYFINTVELLYKRLMREAGVEKEKITEVLKPIKEGKTFLGSTAGKGSPQQIQEDVNRLVAHLESHGIFVEDEALAERLLLAHGIGLDCSGLVYNALVVVFGREVFDDKVSDLLAWGDKEDRRPSRAGAFIFNSPEFATVEAKETQPLDFWIYSDNTHIGIIAELGGDLYLVDCSLGANCVEAARLKLNEGKVEVQGRPFWNKRIKKGGLIVKRMPKTLLES